MTNQEQKSIFIVDDSPTFIGKLKQDLEKYSLQVHCFTNPLLALDEIPNKKPSLIILDFEMPECNGDEFTVKLSERLLIGSTRVILLSGKEFTSKERMSLMTLGIEEFFSKPITEDFYKGLENILGITS